MEAGSSRVANGNVQVGAAVEGENAVSSRVAEGGSSTGTGRVGVEAGSTRVVEGGSSTDTDGGDGRAASARVAEEYVSSGVGRVGVGAGWVCVMDGCCASSLWRRGSGRMEDSTVGCWILLRPWGRLFFRFFFLRRYLSRSRLWLLSEAEAEEECLRFEEELSMKVESGAVLVVVEVGCGGMWTSLSEHLSGVCGGVLGVRPVLLVHCVFGRTGGESSGRSARSA